MVGKPCQPSCQFFQCTQRALQPRRTKRGTELFCSWGEDLCIGPQCIHADCVRKKLKSDLTCGLEPPKPQQFKKVEQEFEVEPVKVSEKWSLDHVPIRAKTLKRIKALKYDID